MFMTRNFISKKKAEEFEKNIKKQKAVEDVKITTALDAFNQKQYRVEWYVWLSENEEEQLTAIRESLRLR